jgi:hypothetical protein
MASDQGLFSQFPSGFPAVPQYFGHTCGRSPAPLTEPDKRISHTSGSSVNPSDCL